MEAYFISSKKSVLKYKTRLVVGFLSGFMSYKSWYNKYDKFVQHNKVTTWCTIPTGRKHYNGETLRRDYFLPTQEGEFEGISVNLPKNVEAYLKNLYGDYMKIPPIEKRERHPIVEFGIDS